MVLSTLRRLFYKHRYIGNAVFYTCLLTSADFVCQKMQFGMLANYDWERTGRMATMGFFYYGPVSTFVYNNLDKLLPGTGAKVVFKKLLFDQFVFTCVSTCIFYVGISLLERKSWTETKTELRKKFLPTYAASFMVWPTAQAINFAVVPAAYRVVYISTIGFFWIIGLSYLKSKSELPYMLKVIEELTKETNERPEIKLTS